MKFSIFIGILALFCWYLIKRRKKLERYKNKELFEEMVLDENCGLYIRKKEAIKIEIDNKIYYFCSKKCLKEFLEKLFKS